MSGGRSGSRRCSTGSRAARRCRRRGRRCWQRLAGDAPAALIAAAGPLVGLRSAEEIAARAEALLQDAKAPPIAAPEAALLYDLLSLRPRRGAALAHLRGIAPMLPAILPAVDLCRRLAALAARGIDVAALPFEASHGRTTLEYYDGFVFSFHGPAGLPPVASGGRYDALTAVLGQGRSIPAVGGIIRPGLVARLRGAGMMLKLGVPSKGRLMEKTFDWFGARGVTMRRTGQRAGIFRRGRGGIAGWNWCCCRREKSRANWRRGASIWASPGPTWCATSWPTGRRRWWTGADGLWPCRSGDRGAAAWIDVETLDDLDAAAAAFRARMATGCGSPPSITAWCAIS
jgi:hypothetical protein